MLSETYRLHVQLASHFRAYNVRSRKTLANPQGVFNPGVGGGAIDLNKCLEWSFQNCHTCPICTLYLSRLKNENANEVKDGSTLGLLLKCLKILGETDEVSAC